MAGATRNFDLSNKTRRAAHARRKFDRNGYPRRVTEALALYWLPSARKDAPGRWRARFRTPAGGYEYEALGLADDVAEPDGVSVFSYDHAEEAARVWAASRGDEAAKRERAGDVTVGDAVRAYISMRIERDADAGRDAELRLSHHVLKSKLADVALAALREKDLADWRKGLKRGGRLGKRTPEPLVPATLKRLLNDFRAALAEPGAKVGGNFAAIVKEGLKAPKGATNAREIQFLPDQQLRAIAAAADEVGQDFGDLVFVLTITGARLGRAAAIRVGDVQPHNSRVMVPTSKKGKGDKATRFTAVPVSRDATDRLVAICAGRAAHDVLLKRDIMQQVEGEIRWVFSDREGWKDSAEMTRPWRAALSRAGLSGDFLPYALRHSSIIRLLRARQPVSLVARLHDTSVKMIEAHYAAHIVDAAEDMLRATVLTFEPEGVEGSDVLLLPSGEVVKFPDRARGQRQAV